MKRRPREIEVDVMSRTETLISWLKKLGLKRMKFKHSYFKIDLLTHAMNQTQIELRTKQRIRRTRWIEVTLNLLKSISYDSCGKFNMEEEERNGTTNDR
ncbi:hypothetical protein HN011_001356 [Eciton burchellii]|nr:hypothetical protein HN011_001356 [Eciton burchellii]